MHCGMMLEAPHQGGSSRSGCIRSRLRTCDRQLAARTFARAPWPEALLPFARRNRSDESDFYGAVLRAFVIGIARWQQRAGPERVLLTSPRCWRCIVEMARRKASLRTSGSGSPARRRSQLPASLRRPTTTSCFLQVSPRASSACAFGMFIWSGSELLAYVPSRSDRADPFTREHLARFRRAHVSICRIQKISPFGSSGHTSAFAHIPARQPQAQLRACRQRFRPLVIFSLAGAIRQADRGLLFHGGDMRNRRVAAIFHAFRCHCASRPVHRTRTIASAAATLRLSRSRSLSRLHRLARALSIPRGGHLHDAVEFRGADRIGGLDFRR